MSSTSTAPVTVRCQAAHEAGTKVSAWSYEMPAEVPAGHVRVRIVASGCCHSDIHTMTGAWGPQAYPLVPGHEMVGYVTAVGEGVSTHAVGDKVGCGPIRDTCGGCADCKASNGNYCLSQKLAYGRFSPANKSEHGGYATMVDYPENWTFRVPKSLPSNHAAPLLCAGITVYAPLARAKKAGHTKVGIVGIGGLGHLAIQFAKALGFEKITAISRSHAKKDAALAMGATHFISVADAEELKGGFQSLSYILSTASSNPNFEALFSLLQSEGVLTLAGIDAADKPLIISPFFLLGGKKMQITQIGNRAECQETLDFAAEHGIAPMVEDVAFDDAQTAIDKMLDNSVRFRSVLIVDEDEPRGEKKTFGL